MSSTGSDSNPGTAAAPWLTLQHAANSVQAGDTVDVTAGTYAGFDLETSGTASAPITFLANSGVTINSPESMRKKEGINLEGASYVTIQGFTVTGEPEAGIRSVTNTNVTIYDNVTSDEGTWGIFTGFSDNLLIDGNTASDSVGQHGIYVSDSAVDPVVTNNLVYGNHDGGIQLNGGDDGGSGIITGALVEDNTIYNNGTGGGSAINGDGLQDSTIENNLLYDNHASGISLFQADAQGPSTGNIVVNNTIVGASDGRSDLNLQNGAVNNTILNNILLVNNSGSDAEDVSPDSMPGLLSDYNAVTDQFTDDSNNYTLAQWQATTGQDAHSFVATAAALFVNPGGDDYHLSSTSPAIDMGTATDAPATDLDNNPRPSGNGYDIGAYEYQVAQAIAPAPTVQAVQVDDGTAQRSAVRSLTVTFSTPVSLGAGAFQLTGLPAGASLVVTPSTGSASTYTITFAGAGIVGGSLPDGHYSLVINAGQVTNSGGQAMTSTPTTDFFRFFGDSNGDGVVDATDFAAFRKAYLSGNATGTNAIYDSNGDGRFTLADLVAFTTNMAKRYI